MVVAAKVRPLQCSVVTLTQLANQLYICPTDTSPLYTDSYSAGTFYVYPFYCGGQCTLTVKLQAIAGATAAEDMSWCAN